MANSKNILFTAIMLSCSFLLKSQEVMSLQDYLSALSKPSTKKKIDKPTIRINQSEFSFDITQYDLQQFEKDLSLFQNQNNQNTMFYLSKRDGVYRGIALDKTKKEGYEITSSVNGPIEFKLKPKDELLFTCWDETKPHETNKKVSKQRRFIGNSKTETALNLQSKPGSPNLYYLDFDGEPFYPGWNFGFTAWQFSDAAIREIWEGVSEDFIGFDINITTNRALFDAHPQARKGWAVFAEFHNTSWSGLAAGQSFGTPQPVLVHSEGQANAFRVLVASHEMGHSFSLSHDEPAGGGYYQGHGEYVPIMGIGSFDVSHWSKGEYPGATNKEDDIQIIAGILGERKDDYLFATELFQFNGNKSVDVFKEGIIETANDLDTFKFEIPILSEVDITIASSIDHDNLDVIATLLDENRNVIVENSPIRQRSASIKEELSTGTYYLAIDGGGELTTSDGFSDYGSIGFYQIKGSAKEIAAQYDLGVASITNAGVICLDSYAPKIKVKNDGYQPISSFDVDVYVDNVLDHSKSFTTSLASGENQIFELNPITQKGNHTIKVELSLNGNSEPNTLNNIMEASFILSEKGNLLRFETDLPSFDGTSGVTWKVKNENSNTVLKESNNINTIPTKLTTIQEYCIAPGCYDFELSGDLKLCGDVEEYANGKIYNKGDQAVVNGKIYEAKWWVSNSKPPASEWNYVNDCESGPFTFTLFDVPNNKQITQLSSSNYNGNYTEDGFCSALVTSSQSNIDFNNKLKLFPNPANNILNIMGIETNIETNILSINGQVLRRSNQKSLFVGDLPTGTYLLQIISEENIVIKRWIKK